MPLRDHFRPPLDDVTSWEGLYGGWPMEIVRSLSRKPPPEYAAEPFVHHGAFEVDVGTFEKEEIARRWREENRQDAMAATWAAPHPTWTSETDLPDLDEYEVRGRLQERKTGCTMGTQMRG